MDCESKLVAILADEIRKELDEEILKDVINRYIGPYTKIERFFDSEIEWEEL